MGAAADFAGPADREADEAAEIRIRADRSVPAGYGPGACMLPACERCAAEVLLPPACNRSTANATKPESPSAATAGAREFQSRQRHRQIARIRPRFAACQAHTPPALIRNCGKRDTNAQRSAHSSSSGRMRTEAQRHFLWSAQLLANARRPADMCSQGRDRCIAVARADRLFWSHSVWKPA